MFTEVNPDKGTETRPQHSGHPLIPICLQKLTPIRGRKLIFLLRLSLHNFDGLQKLTPIRGRKHDETDPGCSRSGFTEVNPDKGTETIFDSRLLYHVVSTFTEVNPDKGTETIRFITCKICNYCLQKLTPIRGRKLSGRSSLYHQLSRVYRS